MQLIDLCVEFAKTNSRGESSSLAVLQNINMQVGHGEVVCVLGPSGCGKSTLLNVLAGFTPPNRGSALKDGEAITIPGPDRAMVFQDDALFPWLTARQNIEFGPGCRRDAARLAEVDNYIEMVGLRGFDDFRPCQLSGGMKQRIALARAMVNHAEVLLLDEPFGSLDAQTRETMQELLLAVHERLRPSIVFVTHDIEEAAFLGDRVLIMTPRPAVIGEDIRVSLPRPRTSEMRDAPEVIELRKHLRNTLRQMGNQQVSYIKT